MALDEYGYYVTDYARGTLDTDFSKGSGETASDEFGYITRGYCHRSVVEFRRWLLLLPEVNFGGCSIPIPQRLDCVRQPNASFEVPLPTNAFRTDVPSYMGKNSEACSPPFPSVVDCELSRNEDSFEVTLPTNKFRTEASSRMGKNSEACSPPLPQRMNCVRNANETSVGVPLTTNEFRTEVPLGGNVLELVKQMQLKRSMRG